MKTILEFFNSETKCAMRFAPRTILNFSLALSIGYFHSLQGQPTLNLEFEEGLAGWSVGGKGYDVKIDSSISHSGHSLRIGRIGEGDFATASTSISLQVDGHESMRLSGYIRTNNVHQGYAGLWLRVDGKDGPLVFENMQGRGPLGNTEWANYEISVVVDSTATQVFFGALLSGAGTAWFDSFRLEVGGHEFAPSFEMQLVSDEQIRVLGYCSQSIGSIDPANSDPKDFEDLRFLEKQIGSRRIVIIGHGTHGTSEIFRMADRITRFLCLTQGFKAIGIESNFPETKTVNDFLQTGDESAEEVLGLTPYWIWKTEEFLGALEWIKEVNNAAEEPLELFGFDAIDPIVASERARDIIESCCPSDLGYFDETLGPVKEAFVRRSTMPDSEKIEIFKQMSNGVSRVLDQIRNRMEGSGNEEEREQLDWACQYIQTVLQVVNQLVPGLTTREQVLAENVKSFLARATPNQKIILWAHNSHAQRQGKNYKPMGSYLVDAYPNEVAVIGTFLYEGEYSAIGVKGLGTYYARPTKPGSIEELFHRIGINRLMFDVDTTLNDDKLSWLRLPQVMRVIGAREGDQTYSVSNLPKEYDTIIFFNTTTATNLLPSAY